jgi:hypothetical protein
MLEMELGLSGDPACQPAKVWVMAFRISFSLLPHDLSFAQPGEDGAQVLSMKVRLRYLRSHGLVSSVVDNASPSLSAGRVPNN